MVARRWSFAGCGRCGSSSFRFKRYERDYLRCSRWRTSSRRSCSVSRLPSRISGQTSRPELWVKGAGVKLSASISAAQSARARRRPVTLGIARDSRMPAGQGQEHGPEQPAGPKIFSKRDERDNGEQRDPAMQAWRDGKHDVAAIELAAGQQVERGGEHSDPRGSGDRMERERGERRADVQQAGREMESQRKSQLNVGRGRTDCGMREREPV